MARPFVYILSLAPLISCSKPGPEEVLEDFCVAMSSGNCAEAFQFATARDGRYLVQDRIDAGCKAYAAEVIHIHCTISGTQAHCSCVERFERTADQDEPVHRAFDVTRNYSLELEHEEWKVYRMDSECDYTYHDEIGGLDMSPSVDWSAKKPEVILDEFEDYMTTQDCESAQNLVVGLAYDYVQALIEAGCNPYKRSVDTIRCADMQGYISCTCFYSDDPGPVEYILKVVDGEWKIVLVDLYSWK